MNIIGTRVSVLTLESTVDRIVRWAQAPLDGECPRYVCATTVHGLMEGQRDPAFLRVLNQAAIVTADGMPLVWFARIRGHHEAERVYGPTLMLEVCRATTPIGTRHYFYGGAPAVSEALARRLSQRYPGLQVAGWFTPPFRSLTDVELGDVAKRINDTGADIVWVGLSTPKQERFIDALRPRVAAKVVLSVGAAFDFHTGRLKQAPPVLQRAGLEWAFRLAQEPRRLWRRYLRNNPAFVALAALQLAGLRRFDEPERQPASGL